MSRKLRAIHNLPSEQTIREHHADRMAKLGLKYEPERHSMARAEFISENRKLQRSSIISKLKSFRDFRLAHNIEPEKELDKATLNDLLEITEAVNKLVDLAGYILESSLKVYPQLSDRAEKTTRMLLAALPALVDIEKE